MNRLVKRFGKYNVATFVIMGIGLILFLLAPTGWSVGFDSDILGFIIFVIGLFMWIVGLIVRRVRGNFLKSTVVSIISIVVLGVLIGVIGHSTCETPASVVTNNATEITANSAILHGEMTDLNDSVGADLSFQWGTISLDDSKSYPNETAAVSRETAGAFNFRLTGLTSNTTYYYRAKADCGNYGTRYGDENSFSTP